MALLRRRLAALLLAFGLVLTGAACDGGMTDEATLEPAEDGEGGEGGEAGEEEDD